MRTHITVAARRKLALRTAVRYKKAARPEKKGILDEFLESTGFHRKHATRLLNDILRGERPRREPRGRVRRYGPAVQAALIAAWRTVNYVCGKRLVPFLPEPIPTDRPARVRKTAISRDRQQPTSTHRPDGDLHCLELLTQGVGPFRVDKANIWTIRRKKCGHLDRTPYGSRA